MTVSCGDICIKWNYFTSSLPSGISSANLKALYQFDGPTAGLTDRSGNGHNLSKVNGTEAWSIMQGSLGINGLQLIKNTYYAGPTGLYPGTTGAMTVEWIWTPFFWTDATDDILTIVGPDNSELEENNFVCRVIVNTHDGRLGYFHEYGAGSNETDFSIWTGPLGHIQYGAMTRSADGLTHKFYLDGELVETLVAGNAPTGGDGADVSIRVGGYDGSTDLYAYMHSIRYVQECYSDDNVLESYNSIRQFACPEVPACLKYTADFTNNYYVCLPNQISKAYGYSGEKIAPFSFARRNITGVRATRSSVPKRGNK